MTEPRPRVWVSQPLFDDIVGRLKAHFDVRATEDVTEYTPAQVADALRDADGALVTLNERIGADEIAGAARLRAIANVGVGYNNLDIGALTAAGIVATNTPDVLTETTADFGFALLMATARRITEAERWLREGQWRQWSFGTLLGADLHGSTLGILGMGRIGQGIARRASGFDMRVLYHNRSRLPEGIERETRATYAGFDDLLSQSDHLVLVLPYSPQAHHLIDAAALAKMKPTATLVNIARGGIVDELALVDALANGRLAAAGLDVYEGEPVVRPELLALRNVVLTPHIASGSLATRRAMVSLAVDNLIAALGEGDAAGHPPTPVNPEALGAAHAGNIIATKRQGA
ncbi:D-glycerate dehydrogenase [Pseudoxanthomonas putridarboris]|uniref:D-glycerate dehydrogenase n=1 Tax=Pseudoxanthomonas putridarboris TaxID=752605 RepID=A0ABU9J107_9GAMM